LVSCITNIGPCMSMYKRIGKRKNKDGIRI
jgi:hypothetical protein